MATFTSRLSLLFTRKSSPAGSTDQPLQIDSSTASASAPESSSNSRKSSRHSAKSSKIDASKTSTSPTLKTRKAKSFPGAFYQKLGFSKSQKHVGVEDRSGSASNQHPRSSIKNDRNNLYQSNNINGTSASAEVSLLPINRAFDIHYQHLPPIRRISAMTMSSKETAIFSPNKENDKKHDSCHPRGSAPSETPERRPTLSPENPSPASSKSDQSSSPKEQKRPKLTPTGPSASINKPNEQINDTSNEPDNEDDIATLSDSDSDADTDSDSSSFIPLTRHSTLHPTHQRLTRTPTPAPKNHTVPSELLHLNLEETRLNRFFSTRAARTRSTRRAILHNLHRYRYALADAGINTSIASRVWMWRHRGDIWASEEEEKEGVTRMYADAYVRELVGMGEEERVEVEHEFVREFWGGREDVCVREAWGVLFGGEEFGFGVRGYGLEEEVGPRGEKVGEW